MANSPSPSSSDPGKPPPRWLLKAVTRIHVFLHGLTGGLNKLGGDEVCFVTMTGAKSGRRLTIPLMYVPHGGGVLLVASQGGMPMHPVWYLNLVANPDCEVQVRSEGAVYIRPGDAERVQPVPAWRPFPSSPSRFR